MVPLSVKRYFCQAMWLLLSGLAVWAQLYLWLKIYLFCPAVVFRFLHRIDQYSVRLQLGIKSVKKVSFLNSLVSYGHMVFFN